MAAEYTDVFYQNVASSTLLSLSPYAFLAPVPLFGFFYRVSGAIIAPIFYLVDPMIEEPSTLYAKLLGETSTIEWKALEKFFAKGELLWVSDDVDLIEAAQAVSQDEAGKVAQWMAEGALDKVSDTQALDFAERDPVLWAVVVSPWILIQERAEN